MNSSADRFKEFSDLIDQHRPREAFVLFLEQIKDKPFSELPTPQLAMLDTVCQRGLPDLLEHHTLWMVNYPDRLRRMLKLLTDALAVRYHPAATVDHIAWLRCLLAIEEAMAGRIERAHKELCLVSGELETESVPEPNGTLRQQIQSIELAERSAAEFLKLFFAAYLEFLKRVGKYELSNHIENRIDRLLTYIDRDENRPGVARALFYDKHQRIGHSGFVHVSMERQPHHGERAQFGEPIEYTRKKEDTIDAAMQEAAIRTQQAVDTYLKRTGYPDGLDERLVHWEIATVRGDAVKLERRFQGGSVALPLAVAIISQYLARPVPNDVAFTGAFTTASVANGRILPVDGVPEKVQHVAISGCKLIYVPTANLTEIDVKPALRDVIAEHNARIVAVETLDQVCEELFPPEGSGRLLDTIKDTTANFLQILHAAGRPKKHVLVKSAHERHRTHIIACSILTAALMLLEGWRLYKTFAPECPPVAAWGRIIIAAVIVFSGMCLSFALPAGCLRHRKAWSWYAGVGVLAVCFAAGVFLLGLMLPDFTHISNIYNVPPAAGLMKDVFIIWIFAWAIAANTFNAVAALEDLVGKRQFVTARLCLRWDSPFEARMGIRCIHFPWNWGVLAIGVAAAYLIILEVNYYGTVDMSTDAGYWETFLGFARDLLFAIAIAEVMVFYKTAIARIRKSLS